MCYCLIISVHVFSTELTLLLRGVVIPENEVLDKEDLGVYPDEAGALSVVTPYSGALSFHYPTDALVPEESVGFFWISSTETFSNGSQIIRLRRREEREQSASQEGVWRCSVPSDASGGRRNIYFGLYTRSEYDSLTNNYYVIVYKLYSNMYYVYLVKVSLLFITSCKDGVAKSFLLQMRRTVWE